MNRVQHKNLLLSRKSIGKSVTYPELWLRCDVRNSGAELLARGMA